MNGLFQGKKQKPFKNPLEMELIGFYLRFLFSIVFFTSAYFSF